jgi:hypothetical protein
MNHTPEQLEALIQDLRKKRTSLFDVGVVENETDVIRLLESLPKISLPIGIKQYRFADKQAVVIPFWRKFMLVPMSILLIAAGLGTTTIAALSSTPGQKLFTIKKAVEQTKLAFVVDPENKAKLQLELTQKRLAEAESILYGPVRDQKAEAAALAELSSQAQTTADAVKQIPNGKDKEQKLAVADKLQQASEGLQRLQERNSSSASAHTAAAKTQVETLRKLLVADSETTTASLQNPQTITGNIQNKVGNEIIVDNKRIEISGDTKISKEDGALTLSDLKINQQVYIQAVASEEKWQAIEIVLTNTGSVKSAVTEKPKVNASSTTVSSEIPGLTAEDEPPRVISRIIVEDPAPQYAP